MHPTLFEIGNFKLPTFGLLVMLGFVAGLLLAQKRAPRYGITKAQMGDLALVMLVAGILGARIGFIVQEIPYYREHPNELFSLQFQGMTSFGGVLLGFVALAIGAKKLGKPILTVLDVATPGFLLGHAFGRVGCLLNGCCYGGQCDLPWAIPVKEGGILLPGLYHPAQIYDSLMNLAALAILLLVLDKRRMGMGQIAGYVFLTHGLARFIYEFWRAGTSSTTMGSLPITEAHVAALIIVAIGAVLLIRGRKLPSPVETEPAVQASPTSEAQV